MRDVDAFIRRAAEQLGVGGDVLGSRTKAPATVRAREIIAIVGVERFGGEGQGLGGATGQEPGQREPVDRAGGAEARGRP